jgi:hypothetical protein
MAVERSLALTNDEWIGVIARQYSLAAYKFQLKKLECKHLNLKNNACALQRKKKPNSKEHLYCCPEDCPFGK